MSSCLQRSAVVNYSPLIAIFLRISQRQRRAAARVAVPSMATLDEAVAMLQDMLPAVLLGSEDSLLDTLGATVVCGNVDVYKL